eukprot:Pompholyxophrys_punicea_v1_NODE_882_length_1172_cov_4.241503.p1 type:complete len:114 gc:universal NODE_882_length_1172_cov_4.241503:815-1156(+)
MKMMLFSTKSEKKKRPRGTNPICKCTCSCWQGRAQGGRDAAMGTLPVERKKKNVPPPNDAPEAKKPKPKLAPLRFRTLWRSLESICPIAKKQKTPATATGSKETRVRGTKAET